MKKSIFTTFLAVFSIILVMYVLLFTLMTSGQAFNILPLNLGQYRGNIYGIWILISVAGLLALIFTLFNHLENMTIQQRFQKDIQRLEENQAPKAPELQAVHEKIMKMSAELQELSKQKSADKAEIIETERKRISRELHDSVSQELFAATMILSSVAGSTQSLSKEQIETQTQLVLKVLHSAQNEMRALLLHLRPVELDGKRLSEGLSALTDELQAKISANITVKLADIETSRNIEDNLFRMAQEILSNTLRHAQADHIEVALRETSGSIILKIADDGVGFDTSTSDKTASYGLANIKERALLLGGDAKVISAPNAGTTVEIIIPKAATL
ncbi:sensor histidine kinase [Lactococcus kimchii]|uniref:sensor histidine kinase n=1 Tax=Lactococcus sp. S-13 TaxID=2507158 RepID=UPI0010236325|nr:sensor histidine kinase [Lactococcus sp. S-13]RZI48478.1 sensor histidine kinase [Lactococcus sp. S-13]